ncbi:MULTISPECIES: BON domain-containing protein [Pseudomonas]|jgi:osmotically-inducible protein OsmY|uniref:BON domain-containing protein n=4 Tax=Pseudomonas TaxID=286 RepID=A0A9X8EGP5_PSEPU|nr:MULTISPECIES: BON domain-containing protein [Pseudomonas]KIU50253.1 transporter [Pseudomonas putida]KTC17771.1 transporter [Pseudomonas putida]MCP8348780.1 BON domain-containing protein [Pseudomonas sp. FBF18]MEC6745005.1 BON domain-containing protein [Pseudomonas qingdaonensis]OOV98734.1 transporter [Pseudomonas sp. MF6396]
MRAIRPLAVLTAALLLTPLGVTSASAAEPGLQQARQEGALQTALALNRLLNPFKIEVAIQGQTARLQGEVENEVERELAAQVALATAGIEQVDNQLQVNPELVDETLQRRAYAQRLEDATLGAVIRARLLWSSQTQGLPIEVDSRAGVVTLRGRVTSAEAKQMAGSVAASTDGVYLVNNLISLGVSDPAQAREQAAAAAAEVQSDAWINDKVQTSFLYSRNLDGPNIKVATQEGVVRLSGEVMSNEQKTIAQEIARQIRGVRGVDADMLKVAIKVEG